MSFSEKQFLSFEEMAQSWPMSIFVPEFCEAVNINVNDG